MLPECILIVDVDTFDLQILDFQNPDESGFDKVRIVADNWGAITSVSYSARTFGISRKDTIESAISKCPELKILKFPLLSTGKPNYTGRRDLTYKLIQCITTELPEMIFEMSSSDEFYIDITPEVHRRIKNRSQPNLQGLWSKTIFEGTTTIRSGFETISNLEDLALLHGAEIGTTLMVKILDKIKVQTSMGIGHNKLVAKLAVGINKPAGITIISRNGGLITASKKIPLTSVPHLGGINGELLSSHYSTMYDLSLATVEEIMAIGNITNGVATKILDKCRGIGSEPLVNKTYAKILSVAQTFPEKTVMTRLELRKQLEGLMEELSTRIYEEAIWHRRKAKDLSVSVKLADASNQGIFIKDIRTMLQTEILSRFWNEFQHASSESFNMKRIELTVKSFEKI